jgi:NADH-quinone oxidoreductase subunit J
MEWGYGLIFGVVFAGLILALLYNRDLTGIPGAFTPQVVDAFGNVQILGAVLYSRFLLPVEVTSVLLLVAAVGAVYLAARKIR